MPFYRLLAFKMGELKEGCDGFSCLPDSDGEVNCRFRKDDKCKLYSCPECGEFITEGKPVVRVIFQATHKMEARRQHLYGRGIHRDPKDATAFVTFHKDCYMTQLDRWIDVQLAITPKLLNERGT